MILFRSAPPIKATLNRACRRRDEFGPSDQRIKQGPIHRGDGKYDIATATKKSRQRHSPKGHKGLVRSRSLGRGGMLIGGL